MVAQRELAQAGVALLLVELGVDQVAQGLHVLVADPLLRLGAGMEAVDRAHHVADRRRTKVHAEDHAFPGPAAVDLGDDVGRGDDVERQRHADLLQTLRRELIDLHGAGAALHLAVDGEAVGKAGLSHQRLSLGDVKGIGLDVGLEAADAVRRGLAAGLGVLAVKLLHDALVEGVVERLAHALVLEGRVLGVVDDQRVHRRRVFGIHLAARPLHRLAHFLVDGERDIHLARDQGLAARRHLGQVQEGDAVIGHLAPGLVMPLRLDLLVVPVEHLERTGAHRLHAERAGAAHLGEGLHLHDVEHADGVGQDRVGRVGQDFQRQVVHLTRAGDRAGVGAHARHQALALVRQQVFHGGDAGVRVPGPAVVEGHAGAQLEAPHLLVVLHRPGQRELGIRHALAVHRGERVHIGFEGIEALARHADGHAARRREVAAGDAQCLCLRRHGHGGGGQHASRYDGGACVSGLRHGDFPCFTVCFSSLADPASFAGRERESRASDVATSAQVMGERKGRAETRPFRHVRRSPSGRASRSPRESGSSRS